MPLVRRLPKFGFTNASFKKEYDIINLSQLSKWEGKLSLSDIVKNKLAKKGRKVKVLGNGKIEKALIIEAHKFSRSAREKIEKQGGKAVLAAPQKR